REAPREADIVRARTAIGWHRRLQSCSRVEHFSAEVPHSAAYTGHETPRARPGNLRRHVRSGHAGAASVDRGDSRRRHSTRQRAVRVFVRASQLRGERRHRRRLRRRARRRDARDDARSRLRSRQELGREERSVSALEPDCSNPKRHADRCRRQERPVDDRRRRRRARGLGAISPAVSLFLLAAPARAQIYESVGIRAQGMGGAFVAVADDADATWWNPAGLAGGAYFSAIIEYGTAQDPSAATDVNGSVLPSWRSGARGFTVTFPSLGLSYYRLQVSQI